MALDISCVPLSPVIRSFYARALSEKCEMDSLLTESDHSYRYKVTPENFTEGVFDKFIQFHEDVETKAFLDQCLDESDWLFTQLFRLMAHRLLEILISGTTVYGMLGMGSMYIFSQQQFDTLLGVDPEWKANKLLDLGAGQGTVTQRMERHFKEVYVTEVSTTMMWHLRQKGYRLLDIDQWANGEHVYDVISCLNLLDKCERPLDILTDIRKSLKPHTGRAIVAVVLPFDPDVEFGNNWDGSPEQELNVTGPSFGHQVSSFVTNVFEPLGFHVESFTRLPYISEGDFYQSYHLLINAVFVLSA